MQNFKKHSLEIESRIPMSFYFEKHKNSEKRLLLFLHGYTDSASSFLRRAYEGVDLAYDFLAPNGPFPVPVRTDQGFKEAYSWYFEDHSIGRVIIPKEVTIDMLTKLISELGLQDHKKTIVGFSQGGFLAPKLSEKLSSVEKIIGIGCDYRADLYENIQNIKLFGIHGTNDETVNYQKSFDNYKSLISSKNFKGEFASIEGMNHKMNEEAKAKLIEFIQA